HTAKAPMMAIQRGAGWVVRRQIVKGGRHPGRVKVFPEGNALPFEHGLGQLVVERPKIEGQLVIAYLPAALARHCFRGRVEGLAFVVGMAGNKVEDAVRTRPCPIDEIGPGDGTLWRDAGPEIAETACFSEFGEVWEPSFLHHGLTKHRIHAVDT